MADNAPPTPGQPGQPGQPGTIQPQPLPPEKPNFTPGAGSVFALLGAVALGVGLYLFNTRVLRRPPDERRPPEGRPPEQQQLPPPPVRVPEIPVEPRPERARLEVELRQAGEKEDAQRAAVEALAARTDPEARAQLEVERGRLRELEEERKKAEYRLRKVSDAEDKERRKAEAEARARIEAEEKARIEAEEKARAAAEAEAQRQKVEAVAGRTLADGLAKTRTGFIGRLSHLFGASKQVDEKTLAELEEILFTADIGVQTAQRLLDLARAKVKARELDDGDKLKAALRAEIERILALEGSGQPLPLGQKPTVLMVVGVNGSGKTTTIGKLAAQYVGHGKGVVLGAGDTFRAAAGEQLEVWAQRAKVPIVQAPEGSDPGAVLFDAIKKGQASGADIVICDTAGRLHTNEQLMEELKKVKRVIGKAHPGAPHEVLLVIDSTNGQTAIAQAKKFHEALGVTGIALTKLDGTAKGGVIIGICDELKLPVRYVGVGEGIEDLQRFDPHGFVEALFQ